MLCASSGEGQLVGRGGDLGCKEGDLADGLEFGPGVGATHFQRRVIVEDVVAKIVQWRLRVCGGKLSGILNLLPYLNINLLQKVSVFKNCGIVHANNSQV